MFSLDGDCCGGGAGRAMKHTLFPVLTVGIGFLGKRSETKDRTDGGRREEYFVRVKVIFFRNYYDSHLTLWIS